ncbi:MAG: hypothetical protein IH599_10255, partial [Bacteroidales bacterium]|nr:hypothetical protein [Bacteroidales bacterium]
MLAHDTLAWVQNYLWIAAAAMLVLQIIGRIWPISKLLTLTLIPPGVFLLAAAAYLIFIPKSNLSVAWRVDQDLGLKERVSS